MKTLNQCENLFGKISPQIQKRIKNYIKNPSFDNWNDISSIIINAEGMKTIWQAILKIDPSFPMYGRCTNDEGIVTEEWKRIPSPLQVLQAINNICK